MYIYDEIKMQMQREYFAIKAWRKGKDRTPLEEGLVGLALSGGGIRSATFSLGVLERLKQIGLLERIDYLSTVSGGGYIGGWLSTNCLRHAPPPDVPQPQQSSWLAPETDWRESIAHLRRFSNYLSPKLGLLSADTWTMGTVWLRNALLMQMMIVLMIVILLLLPRVLQPLFVWWPNSGSWRWITVALFSAAAAGIARNERQLSNISNPGESERHYLLGLLCIGDIVALNYWKPDLMFSDGPTSLWVWLIAIPVLIAAYYLLPLIEKGACKIHMNWTGSSDKMVQDRDYGQGAVQRLVVLPMVAVGFLLGAVLWGQSSHAHGPGGLASIGSYGAMWKEAAQYWELPLILAFGALGLFACRSTERKINNQYRINRYSIVVPLATIFSGLVLHYLMTLIMLSLNSLHSTRGASWCAMVWAPPAILFSFSLAIVMLIGIQGINTLETVREWWSRMGAWLCIYGMAWMVVMVSAVYGPIAAAYLLSGDTWAAHYSAIGTWLLTTLGGIMAGKSGKTGATRSGETQQRSPLKIALNLLALAAPIMLIITLLIAVSTGIQKFMTLIKPPGAVLSSEHLALLDTTNSPIHSVILLVAAAFVLTVMIWRVDVNEFSLNAFYRNRLARCYLGATRFCDSTRHPQPFIGFDEKDDLPLADLRGPKGKLAGPFHIFNCALNLGGSSDLSLHTRHCATFTLTPRFVGSCYGSTKVSETGLCATSAYYKSKQPLTVAKAMAVSGAAASPNMGFHTSPLVAFALTLFNVRLGWWFPTPRKPKDASPTFGLMYLLYEMFGLANAKSDFLMISDGGHFENLAAYELVARRCRVIIISDAECDPELKFEGLGTLIRMCKVDHATEIQINVRPIRDGEQTYAIGTIIYPECAGVQPGILIYLKASMTGTEGSDVLQYKASHHSFPHESTGNQFYGEDQFESYRSLGIETASRALAKVSFTPKTIQSTVEILVAKCQIP